MVDPGAAAAAPALGDARATGRVREGLDAAAARAKPAHPGTLVEVWAEDEHRRPPRRHTYPAEHRLPQAAQAGSAELISRSSYESFFATLECERFAKRRCASQLAARMATFSHVEGWYNPARLHPALACRPPVTCEQEMTQAAVIPT